MFAHFRLFQLSWIFLVRPEPSRLDNLLEFPLRIFLRPYLERFRDKRTSLFSCTLSDEEKSFTTTTLGASLLAGTEPDVVAADVGGGARDGEPSDDVISRRPE